MLQSNTTDRISQLTGAILGTAVGDALGLPREGLSRSRAIKIFGGPPLRDAFMFGRGMTSDDTEHTCMTAQALLASQGNTQRFAQSLAWRLRFWILGLPAGVGLATARATIKLWLGFGPSKSGVWSAGNGPAMRAAIIGVYAKDDIDQLLQLVRTSTRITHSDPEAEHGALAVALAAAYSARIAADAINPIDYLSFIRPHLAGTPLVQLLESVANHLDGSKSFEEYLQSVGLTSGISGYINHTVPAAIFCWLKWPNDFRNAVEQIILAGGDTDTTAAIVGALVGINAGADSIPHDWLAGLFEWPRNLKWMKRLGSALASDDGFDSLQCKSLPLFWPGLPFRNLVFLSVVLFHGFRRAFPPY